MCRFTHPFLTPCIDISTSINYFRDKRNKMINVNKYFDGYVKSLSYATSEGKSTVGVMEPGEYEFETSMSETMIVIEGELEALLPGEPEWKTYTSGNTFDIPANSSFKVRALGQTSYLCKYI